MRAVMILGVSIMLVSTATTLKAQDREPTSPISLSEVSYAATLGGDHAVFFQLEPLRTCF